MSTEDREIIASHGAVALGRFRLDDFEAVHEYATDPLVYRFAEWGPNSPQETIDYLTEAMVRDEQNLCFAVLLDARLIGGAAVWRNDSAHLSGELGYSLNSKFWGQGIATTAARLLLELGFERLNLHRIIATCAPQNLGSARVLEKNGFSYEGRLREHKLVRGQRRDSLLFSKLRTDQ